MHGPRKLGTRARHLRVQCFAKNILARIAPYTLMSHTKMLIVCGRGRGKQSLRSKCSETRKITTAPITVRVQTTKTLTKNRQLMALCSYCRYYLNITVQQIILQ